LANRWFVAALALVIAYALIDEYHQTFVPSRSGSVYDSFIDMAGGLTALLLIRHHHHRARRFSKSRSLSV
jgi:VanZ family protein